MRVSKRAQQVSIAQAELGVVLSKFQRDQGLTNVEMLQGIVSFQASTLKFMLRAERNPDDPSLPADEEREPKLYGRLLWESLVSRGGGPHGVTWESLPEAARQGYEETAREVREAKP